MSDHGNGTRNVETLQEHAGTSEKRQDEENVGLEISTTNTHRSDGEKEVIMVDWDGPNDPENPLNWSYKKKWAATIMVSVFTFISPVASSMVAPATANVAEEFGITNPAVMALTVSVFVLAYAFGPLVLGPMSELYGRSKIIQLANVFFFVWNLACGFAQDQNQLIVFRFFAGLGGSAPLSAGAGTLGDIWRPEERGQAIAIYSMAPMLGPALGPVAGGWIAERTTWRWVFWSSSILCLGIQVLGLYFLRESYAPVLLDRKARKILMTLDAEKGAAGKEVRTPYTRSDRTWQNLFARAMIRPFALFVHEPIIQVIGIYMALVYGIFYLFLTTIPSIFGPGGVYNQRTGIAGLHYISLGIGLVLSAQVNARVLDRVYAYFQAKNGGVGQPEFRVPSMLPGAVVLPLALLLTGWGAEYHVHWIVADIGLALVGAGIILIFQAMQTYVVDTFTLHAASAMAAVSCLRALFGFIFPLFAPKMYEKLGFGRGNTLLAGLSILIGVPAPFLFWKYGKTLRMKSRYTKKS